MCPRLNHLSFMNHSYQIRVVDSGEMVSNDNGGSSLPCFVKSFLDNFLTLRVQSGGGFVKEEDFGVSD